MTTAEVLETIKREYGESALRDGKRLQGLFADCSRGQMRPQTNALRIFLECSGNTRILNLRAATYETRQRELHRLVQEMVISYSMQGVMVQEICGAFWQITVGGELPLAAAESEQKPEPARQPEIRQVQKQLVSTLASLENEERTQLRQVQPPAPDPIEAARQKGFEISREGVLTKYTGKETDVVIPDCVKIIGDGAFDANWDLKSVTIPEGVTKIEQMAFYFCSELETVTLPESLSKIGEDAFGWCDKLVFPKLPCELNLKHIGTGAFNKASLSKAVLPGALDEVNLSWLAPFPPKVVSISAGTRTVKIQALQHGCFLEIPDTVSSVAVIGDLGTMSKAGERIVILASDQWVSRHKVFLLLNKKLCVTPSLLAHTKYYRNGRWSEEVWQKYGHNCGMLGLTDNKLP